MKLKSINRWLKKVGLVLVVQTGSQGEPIWLRVERASAYNGRIK